MLHLVKPQQKNMTTGKKFLIRSATVEDASMLVSITHFFIKENRFNEEELDECSLSEERTQQHIQEVALRANRLTIVAQLADYILGYASYEPYPLRRLSHSGQITLHILKEWRGKGIGSGLMEYLLDWANQPATGVEKLYFKTLSSNQRALALARKFAFKEEWRSPKAIKINPEQYADGVTLARFISSN